MDEATRWVKVDPDGLAEGWARWRTEKTHREALTDHQGRLHPALVFSELSALCPDDTVIAVDVGNNTYSFGRFFECRGRQDSTAPRRTSDHDAGARPPARRICRDP